MIVNAILNMLYTVIGLILTPITSLSDVVLDSNFANSFQAVRGYLANMDQVIPVVVILSCVGIIVVVEALIMGYNAINWLIRKIPTIN